MPTKEISTSLDGKESISCNVYGVELTLRVGISSFGLIVSEYAKS